MIFFTKLTKRKKSNSSPSFTILELVLVIVIIGILASSLSFNFAPDRLQIMANQIIKDIRYTQSLAIKDNKYQPFPKSSSSVDQNQSAFWFKQWWQIRFNCTSSECYYEVFSDLPDYCPTCSNKGRYNFDRVAATPTGSDKWNLSIAKDPLTNKYLTGVCDPAGSSAPKCSEIEKTLNLTESYGIKRIDYVNFGTTHELLFDSFGNVFKREGDNYTVGTPVDTNPLDKNERKLLTSTAKIKLCTKINTSTNRCDTSPDVCIQINISPNGEVYKSNCQ